MKEGRSGRLHQELLIYVYIAYIQFIYIPIYNFPHTEYLLHSSLKIKRLSFAVRYIHILWIQLIYRKM